MLSTSYYYYSCYFLDGELSVWTGGFSSDRVALLACVATGGFHSVCSYQWHTEEDLSGEVYPLFYTSTKGQYTCTVSLEDTSHKFTFSVDEGAYTCVLL